MSQLPTGTVTFLFTDIQGSAPLAQNYPAELPALLARHNTILHEAIARHHGYVFRIVGDAFCAAFSTANDGFAAALDAQDSLQHEPWQPAPVSVRMGLHTGEAWAGVGEEWPGDYSGYLTLTRAQRVMSAAHGGQVLLSSATAELLRGQLPPDVILRDMGEHRLKGVLNPEHLWQMVAPHLRHDFPALATLNKIPTNLPIQLTSFIGRGREMGEIAALLSGTRLVTLTGTGGTGKTRLALEVAAHVIDEFPAGAWFVELAPLQDGAQVGQSVVSALGLQAQPNRPLVDLLVDYLRDKRLLLVLDNCEHVLDACAALAGRLLGATPNLQILATSRAPLNLAGEMLYPVPPLSAPGPGAAAPLPNLTQYEAVRLFIVRGQAARPAFTVTNANAPTVAQICQHLDGIPLAIELAAARLRLLSPEQIAARLSDRFTLLTGGSRTALPRQQTLRATLDWSYSLLTPPERRLFNRLAVFAGSFSLAAVEAVGADAEDGAAGEAIRPAQVLDLLAGLVDHSLVFLQETQAENRYGLLETVRQYALEKLAAAGEMAASQARHLAHYLALAQQGKPHILAGRPAWVDRFETEYDNFRAAMVWALASNTESAVLLAKSLNQFAFHSQRIYESADWAARILALTEAWPSGRLRATALWLAGDNAANVEEYQRAQDWLKASIEMAGKLDEVHLIALCLASLIGVHLYRGDWERLAHYASQLLSLSEETREALYRSCALWGMAESALGSGDHRSVRRYCEQTLATARQEDYPFFAAHALGTLGSLAQWDGDFDQARTCFTESVQIFKQMKYGRGLAWALLGWGRTELRAGDFHRAKALFEEHLAVLRELKMAPNMTASLFGLAGAAGLAGQDQRASLLFGATEAAYEQQGWEMSDLSHQVYDPIIAAVRGRLGEAAFAAAWAEGRKLTVEQALEIAQAPSDQLGLDK